MSVAVRNVTDERGQVLDRHWYCSDRCIAESIADDPPSEAISSGIDVALRDAPVVFGCAGCGCVWGTRGPINDNAKESQ